MIHVWYHVSAISAVCGLIKQLNVDSDNLLRSRIVKVE